MNRREMLACGAGALLLPLSLRAQTADYRALVCVVLAGGNDSANTVLPWDAARYGAYAAVRGPLALPRDPLLPIDETTALHPSLKPLLGCWEAAELAIVRNVGPLARPLTAAEYADAVGRNDPSQLPESLYSHSHQSSLWECGGTRASQPLGWITRLAQKLPGRSMSFTLAGNQRLVDGLPGGALALPAPGNGFDLGALNVRAGDVRASQRRAAFDALLNADRRNPVEAAFVAQQRVAMRFADELDAVSRQAPGAGTPDPANPELSSAFGHLAGRSGGTLSRQLYQVAKLVKQRAVVGGNRHFFVVKLGGFDTHAGQLPQHAALLAELATALAAFQTAMRTLGTAHRVTTFTLSEFGRTLVPNGTAGTDHGWGADHFVLGGSVVGGRSHGRAASLMPGADDDAGFGRFIPATSVDQYAATLSRWLGLGDASLDALFPLLAGFAPRDLGFMRP